MEIDNAERNLLKDEEFQKLFEESKGTLDRKYSISVLLEDKDGYLVDKFGEDNNLFEKAIEQALKKMGTESLKNRSLLDDEKKFNEARKGRDGIENNPDYIKCGLALQ